MDWSASTTLAQRVDAVLRVPAQPASIALVRGAVAQMLRSRGWPGAARLSVLIAVSEAVTNAVQHGSLPGGPVEVDLSAGEDVAVVRVIDQGRGAPPGQVPSTDRPDERGLRLMTRIAEDVELSARGDGTCVLMRFVRPAREG